MPVRLVGTKKPYHPKDTDEVVCHLHGITTTWGALNAIQRLALEEGIDTKEGCRCLLAPKPERLR